MQTHPARARLPFRSGIAAAQTCQFMPRFAAVFRFEDRRIFDAGVNMIRIVERRFQVPDAFELPRVLGSVVPLMRRDRLTRLGRSIVNEMLLSPFGIPSELSNSPGLCPACSKFYRHRLNTG